MRPPTALPLVLLSSLAIQPTIADGFEWDHLGAPVQFSAERC
jgi:hypothetical protein